MSPQVIDNEKDLLARVREGFARLPLSTKEVDSVASVIATGHAFLNKSLRIDSSLFDYVGKIHGVVKEFAAHGLTEAQYLGAAESHRPGGQHEVDHRYLQRIEALNFTIAHDDGQAPELLDDAEVVLVGASRTSKTPTCVYLAIRGIRAANVPIVPGIPLPPRLFTAKRPLIVGLWASADRLVQVAA